MSSAENGRLVWITREQRDALWDAKVRGGHGMLIAHRWDTAPADPTEAIAKAIYEGTVTCPEDGTDWSVEDDWIRDGYREHEAKSVLAALGVPQRPTPRDEAPHA